MIKDLLASAAALFLIPAVIIHVTAQPGASLKGRLGLLSLYGIAFGFFISSLLY